MKTKKTILIIMMYLSLISCVQESKKQKVTIFLDVSGLKDVKTVGIRGNDKPLSWNEDMEMEVVKKDSLYKKTFDGNTGRL